jgi:hypothetical protein
MVKIDVEGSPCLVYRRTKKNGGMEVESIDLTSYGASLAEAMEGMEFLLNVDT